MKNTKNKKTQIKSHQVMKIIGHKKRTPLGARERETPKAQENSPLTSVRV